MATAAGAMDVHVGAPGPWVTRRIAFHASSTYDSSPAMEPLNGPIVRVGGANAVGVGLGQYLHQHDHHLQEQYYQNQQNQQMSGTSAGAHSNPIRRSERLSLPSSMPLQWTAPQKIGAGLSNLGNTCFLNSVLQCLTYTPPLAGYLQSGQHKASCRVAGFCAFCALQEHVQQALASSGKVVSPQKLAKNLRSVCRSFRMGRQEDSHEYMRYLLEALHKCCLPPDLAKNSNSKSSQEKSLVYRIFGGQLRSQVKCTVCSHCSNTYDPFLDLSLEIYRADSLTKALTRFTAVDVLDGDNKYRCLRCKKKVRALKNFSIDSVPNILTIQFKRFSSTGGQGGKIDKIVEFGTTLDLKPFVSTREENVPKYKLFGVLVHSGWSTHSGHYYSFLRASSDIWHVFDDSRVRQVSEKTVLEQKAYMLFYVREVKWASDSHSELPPKQALPRQLSVLVKERQSNPDSLVTQMQPLSSSASSLSKERERRPLAEVTFKQVSSEPVTVFNNDNERNGFIGDICKSSALQPLCFSMETEQNLVPPSTAIGFTCATSVIHTMNSNGSNISVAATASIPSCFDEAAVGLCSPVGELCVPTKENYTHKETEINSCCTISGAPGSEDDWDEYYKKGWTPPGSTPQNFMKMLRIIPHTRRYYLARAVPVRRASKVVSSGNCEMEIGHVESCKGLAPNMCKDTKRPHTFLEDSSGSKRQRRESGANCVSNTCMALEAFSEKTEPMEVTCSDGLGLDVKDDVLHVKIAIENIASLPEAFSETNVTADLKVGETQTFTSVNGWAESDGHGDAPNDHLSESFDPRELQSSGAELRGDRIVENNFPPLDRSACWLKGNTYSNWPSSDKGAETSNGIRDGTTIATAGNDLYGNAVPWWVEADQDEPSVKEVDGLLELETGSNFKQDIWDVEYDKGRSKKVRNRSNGEIRHNQISTNGAGNSLSKPSNPFQAFGMAKKIGKSIKERNTIGFKAGYGYGLKTGKNVAASAKF